MNSTRAPPRQSFTQVVELTHFREKSRTVVFECAGMIGPYKRSAPGLPLLPRVGCVQEGLQIERVVI